MIMYRLQYDTARYRVVNEYIRARRTGLERAARETKIKIEEEERIANIRGEMLLGFVERDIHRDLDRVRESFREGCDIDSWDILSRDFPLRASKVSRDGPFGTSPDFYKSFDLKFDSDSE